MTYFRWWTFRKHLKRTPDGFVITEFLPPVGWAGKQHDQLRGRPSPARGSLDQQSRLLARLRAVLVPRRRRTAAVQLLGRGLGPRLGAGDRRRWVAPGAVARPGPELRGVGTRAARCERALLAGGRTRRDGGVNQWRPASSGGRPSHNHQQPSMRGRPRHCRHRQGNGFARDPGKGGVERGKDYNHSTFCDLVIHGLVGLCPRADTTVEVHPLLPANTWDYFCLDQVRYHGRWLTVLYDRTGERYRRGKGLRVLADGKELGSRPDLGRLLVTLPEPLASAEALVRPDASARAAEPGGSYLKRRYGLGSPSGALTGRSIR